MQIHGIFQRNIQPIRSSRIPINTNMGRLTGFFRKLLRLCPCANSHNDAQQERLLQVYGSDSLLLKPESSCNLFTLPTEVLQHIAKNLSPVQRTCLELTCTRFYNAINMSGDDNCLDDCGKWLLTCRISWVMTIFRRNLRVHSANANIP